MCVRKAARYYAAFCTHHPACHTGTQSTLDYGLQQMLEYVQPQIRVL